MSRLQHIAIWLNTGDNGFGIVVICCSPLLALILLGMFGGGA